MSFSPGNIAPRFGAELIGKPILKSSSTTARIRLNEQERKEYEGLFEIEVPDVLELHSEPENPEAPFTVNGGVVAGQAKALIKDILLNKDDLFKGGIQTLLLKGFNILDNEAGAEGADATSNDIGAGVLNPPAASDSINDVSGSEIIKLLAEEGMQRFNSLTLMGKALAVFVSLPIMALDLVTLPFRLMAIPFKAMLAGVFNLFSTPENQAEPSGIPAASPAEEK